MPVEINELVIRATISDAPSQQGTARSMNDDAKKIQRILDEVIRKIKSKNER
jgi:hypothetical protein